MLYVRLQSRGSLLFSDGLQRLSNRQFVWSHGKRHVAKTWCAVAHAVAFPQWGPVASGGRPRAAQHIIIGKLYEIPRNFVNTSKGHSIPVAYTFFSKLKAFLKPLKTQREPRADLAHHVLATCRFPWLHTNCLLLRSSCISERRPWPHSTSPYSSAFCLHASPSRGRH